jgi:RNA polymerase sigma-70 factor (ECF subfamily)
VSRNQLSASALACAGATTFRLPAARPEYDLKTVLPARAEEKTALENIYGQETPWLLRAVYCIACQRDIADDVIQDAFIQVWHEAHNFGPYAGRWGWIYSVVAIAP